MRFQRIGQRRVYCSVAMQPVGVDVFQVGARHYHIPADIIRRMCRVWGGNSKKAIVSASASLIW